MKTISRIGFLGLAAVVVMCVAAPAANAGCATATAFGQEDAYCSTCDNTYHYIAFPASTATDTTNVVGRYWWFGNFGSASSGTNDDSQWMKFNFGNFYVNGDLQKGLGGCPCGTNPGDPACDLELVLETLGQGTAPGTGKAGQAFVAVSRVNSTPLDAQLFNFNRAHANLVLAPIPRPRITSSSSNGELRNLSLDFDPVSAFFTGAGTRASSPGTAITGYNIMRKNANTASDDSRVPGTWSLVQTVAVPASGAAPATTPLTIDCTGLTTDVLLGTQLQFADGQVGSYISQSTTVKCHGTLAEPEPINFKIIDRKPAASRGARK